MSIHKGSRYQVCQQKAEVLGNIGAALFRQPTTLTVRLPRELADLALAARRRDDDDGSPPGPETAEQTITRHRAGTLALIGRCIEQSGRADGKVIVCELDAWYIGGALEAADDGFLPDHVRAVSHSKR